MRKQLTFAMICAVFAAGVSAQDAPEVAYDGTWSATIQRTDGARQTSRLVIREFAGSWYGAPNKACRGKPLPVTVQVSSDAELAFTVWGSSIAPACPDLTVALKPIDKKVLEGTVESVGSIKLIRR